MHYTKITPLLLSFLLAFNVACTQGGTGGGSSSDTGSSNDNPSNNPQPDPDPVPQGSLSATFTTENFQNNFPIQTISSNGKRVFTWTITNTTASTIKDLSLTSTPNIQIDSKSTCGHDGYTLTGNSSCTFTLNYTAPTINEESGSDSLEINYSDKSKSHKVTKKLDFKVMKGPYFIPADLPGYNGTQDSSILKIASGNKGEIYLGTSKGITVVTKGKDGYIYNPVDSLKQIQLVIQAIFVDKNGMIYVGTRYNGIYIGTDLSHLTPVKGLENSIIENMYVDNNNIIYLNGSFSFGSSNSEVIWGSVNNDNEFILKNRHLFSGNEAINMIAGNAENVYFQLPSSLWMKGLNNDALLIPLKTLPGGLNNSLYVDKDRAYVSKNNGSIYISSTHEDSFRPLTDSPQNVSIISSNNNGTFYLGVNNILYSGTIDEAPSAGTLTFKQTTKNEMANEIASIFDNNTSEIFVGTRGSGLFIGPDNGTSSEYLFTSVPYPFTEDVSSFPSMDKNGSFYYGTYDSGLRLATPTPAPALYSSAPVANLKMECVNASVSDSQGTMYIASCDDGDSGLQIGKKNGANEYTFTSVSAPFANEKINSLVVGANDLIYAITTSKSLYIGKDENFSQVTQLGLPVESVFVDNKGTVYVGVNNKGIYKAPKESDPSKYKFSQLSTNAPPGDILALFVNPEGTIYVSTNSNGLYKLSGTSFSSSPEIGTEQAYITNITGSASGAIYLGASSGLYYNNSDGSFTKISLPSGLIDPYVQAIRESGEGGIFVGTGSLGIFGFDPPSVK